MNEGEGQIDGAGQSGIEGNSPQTHWASSSAFLKQLYLLKCLLYPPPPYPSSKSQPSLKFYLPYHFYHPHILIQIAETSLSYPPQSQANQKLSPRRIFRGIGLVQEANGKIEVS